ncbi:MAG: RHS repeat-associated core domain-containing protein [Limisphaerales bacterium]
MKTAKGRCLFSLLCLAAVAAIVFSRAANTGNPQGVRPLGQTPNNSNASSLERLGIKPVGDWVTDPQEAQQLSDLFAAARQASAAVQPGPDVGAQRRAIEIELDAELESFLATNPDSAYGPGVRLFLGRIYQLRCAYLMAMDHDQQVWQRLNGSQDSAAKQMAAEASSRLAKPLVLTGRLDEFDSLQAELQRTGLPLGGDGRWALEMRAWTRKHPEESFKCGLYCLDQLGRLTQNGEFRPKDITETLSSLNGFTAAELVNIGTKAGLRVRAALLADTNTLPVPSIVHLRSEHFVILSEQRGAFYKVGDALVPGPKWLTAPEIMREATGCVLVDDAAVSAASFRLQPLDAASAGAFRGRCHQPLPPDHDDNPCIPDGIKCCTPPPTPPHSPPPHNPGPSGPSPSGCATCKTDTTETGMPRWLVTEPWVNLWVTDTPLQYTPAYGPGVSLVMAYNDHHVVSVNSGAMWHGAQFGNQVSYYGYTWTCSLLSFADMDASEATIDLMMPAGNWVTFTFPSGSSVSSVNYYQNTWLEKAGSSGNITSLILHFTDGSQAIYGLRDDIHTPSYWTYFITSRTDPAGNGTQFSYDANFLLTTVTAADGASFTMHYNHPSYSDYITSISTSYGPSVSFSYGETDPNNVTYNSACLTGITDAAGITSHVFYEQTIGGYVSEMITPYGTTLLTLLGNIGGVDTGIFDRTVRITRPDGSQELYALLNTYTTGTDWPDFTAGQIPTSTPVNTLDTTERQDRNTFHWNARQFAPYVNTDLSTFNWSILKQSRIRHWLAITDPTTGATTHWGSLSIEQAPSPDGSAEGQLSWYDYAGKPTGVNYENGTQVLPAVLAQVMPDGSTWYEYFQRTSIGKVTSDIEKWVANSTTYYRTNTYNYAANGIDVAQWYGPNNELLKGLGYNSYHEVLAETNAVGDATTYTYETSAPYRLLTLQTPAQLHSTYSYDPTSGRLTSVVDSISGTPLRTNSYTWLNDDIETQTDPRGMTRTFTVDALHRTTQISFPDTSTIQYAYTNAAGTKLLDRTYVKDRLGNPTCTVYDSLRRVVEVIDARDNTNSYGYCLCGSLDYIRNALQQVTSFIYDNQGHVTQTHYADGTSVTNTYDPLGNLLVRSDALGGTTNTYDNLGRLIHSNSASGSVRSVAFDNEDRPTNVVDANGVSTTRTFDHLGRVLSRTYPDTGVEQFAYNFSGLTFYTNQIGKIWQHAYDAAGRKTNELTPNNERLKSTYNAAGDLLTLTDGKNQTTTWGYDAYGRVISKKDANNTQMLTYNYDANGRVTNRWSSAKNNTAYGYDAVGHLLTITYPVSHSITYSYDALNRLTTMVDAAGTNTYTYSSAGDLASEDGPWPNDTVSYSYHASVPHLRVGLTLQQPSGNWSQVYGYDSGDRLKTVTSSAGTFVYTYQGAGSLVASATLPNATYYTNYFDAVGRQYWTALYTSGGQGLEQSGYQYNPAGQRTLVYRADTSYDTVTYDHDGQAQSAVGSGGESTENLAYSYDAAWNLSQRTSGGVPTAFGVNNLNELSSEPNGTATYDGNGNLTGESNGRSFVYDDENQLTSVSYGTSYRSDFVYDGLGRRRKEIDYAYSGGWYPTGETRFLYDRRTVIQERDGNNNPTVSYTRGNDLSGSLQGAGGIGGLLARSTGASSGALVTAWTTGGTGGTVRNNYSGWVGLQFTVGNAPLTVSGLGRWVVSGNTNAHTVQLFTASGNAISGGSVSVNTAGVPPGQFAYATLSSPITLAANTTYAIMTQETSGGDYWYDLSSLSVTLSGDASGAWACYASPPPPYTLAFGGSGFSYGPVNLQYSTAATFSHAYYHADGNGNIAVVMGSAQNYLGIYRYDPYGNSVYTYDIMTPANVYRASSKEWHASSGLYYYGFRFYDPNLQRWPNRDPIGDIAFLRRYSRGKTSRHQIRLRLEALRNLYTFVHNQPTLLIDPFGLSNYWPWSKCDWFPPILLFHAAFDMGAVPMEGVLGLIDASDTGFDAGNLNRSSGFDSLDNNIPLTAGGDIINNALPQLNNNLKDVITGIPGTSMSGDVSTLDPVGIASGVAQGIVLGPPMQAPK